VGLGRPRRAAQFGKNDYGRYLETIAGDAGR
jgi:hypothetical protein